MSPCVFFLLVLAVHLLVEDVHLGFKDSLVFVHLLIGIKVLENMGDDCNNFWIS